MHTSLVYHHAKPNCSRLKENKDQNPACSANTALVSLKMVGLMEWVRWAEHSTNILVWVTCKHRVIEVKISHLTNTVAQKQEIHFPSADSIFSIADSDESPLEQYLFKPKRWRNVLSGPDAWISRCS